LRISPLRLWLQSASLLAVLAGYSLLLLLHQQLAGLQRQAAHSQLVEQLESELQSRARSREQLLALLDATLLPGLQLQLLPPGQGAAAGPAAAQESSDGQEWLVSQLPLALVDGSSATLRVRQNVSASVQQEWLALELLVVAAGVSSLFTSGLLRLVLQRGLVQPLQEFTAQLSATQAPPLPSDQIPVADQPEELQPIAEAFNDLQERLRASWERQRSFVDGVAHELRTPITLISGHAQSPPVALGDPDRLQQCLAALIENALHYSPAPLPVTLAADGQGGALVLHVRDQGPGVASHERETIFGRFARGSAAIQANSRGSGIGLAVVRLLMEAMGGSVQVAEAPGGGADFQLHLPLARPLEAIDA